MLKLYHTNKRPVLISYPHLDFAKNISIVELNRLKDSSFKKQERILENLNNLNQKGGVPW